MKSKSISFAEVLKRNAKSPKINLDRMNFKLAELVQQFDANPGEDYTLYLGQVGLSHRSKPSPFQMGLSRNQAENQEEMFDSWIQRQSALGSNKENIRNQSKVVNQEPKRFDNCNKIQGSSQFKARNNGNNLNVYTSKGQRQKTLDQSQGNFNQLNIQMIKSNHYEQEQQINKIKSPRAQPQTQQNLVPSQIRNPFLEVQTTKKEEKTIKEISFPNESMSQSNHLKPKGMIEQSISDIVSKYKDESDDQEKEEEMLLAQSNDKQEEIKYNQMRKKTQQADQLLKKRLENAKNILGNYFQKIKKGKQSENDVKERTQRQREEGDSSHLVGYSFSTSYLPEPVANHQNEARIQQIVAQVKEQSQDSDSSFKRKYLNLTSFEAPSNHQASNHIQSVKFSAQRSVQIDQVQGFPYGSYAQSKASLNERNPLQQYKQQYKNLPLLKEQQQSKEIVQAEQTNGKVRSKRKISLISSKSNKRSPTSIKQKQNQAPTTTDFTVIQKANPKPEALSIHSSKQMGFKVEVAKRDTLEPTKPLISPPYATATHNNLSEITTNYYSTYTTKPTTTPYYVPSSQNHRDTISSNPYKAQQIPLKIQNPYTFDYTKKQTKKEPTYALPTESKKYSCFISDNEAKKTYFSKLDIKESITMQDNKSKNEPTYSYKSSANIMPAYSNNLKEYKTGFIPVERKEVYCLDQSLKKSINLSQSGEFTFDL